MLGLDQKNVHDAFSFGKTWQFIFMSSLGRTYRSSSSFWLQSGLYKNSDSGITLQEANLDQHLQIFLIDYLDRNR